MSARHPVKSMPQPYSSSYQPARDAQAQVHMSMMTVSNQHLDNALALVQPTEVVLPSPRTNTPPHKRKHYSGGAVPVQRALPSAPKRAPQGSLCSSHHRAFVDAAARNAPAAEASMRTSSRTLSQREPPRSGPPQYARMQVPGSCTSIFTHRKTRMCMYTCTSAREDE